MVRQTGTDRGQAVGIACADHDPIHAGEHRTVHPIDQGQFDLVQKVDEYLALMPFLGQPDFGKAGGDQEFDDVLVQGQCDRRRLLGPAAE